LNKNNNSKDQISVDMLPKKDTITQKISIFDNPLPFFYIKMDKLSNKYRISLNYEYLNIKYNLKINYIRDLDKIDKNLLFEICNENNVSIEESPAVRYIKDEFKITDDNYLEISKYEDDYYVGTVFYIFKRVYKDDVSYSVLFFSDIFFNLNMFLDSVS